MFRFHWVSCLRLNQLLKSLSLYILPSLKSLQLLFFQVFIQFILLCLIPGTLMSQILYLFLYLYLSLRIYFFPVCFLCFFRPGNFYRSLFTSVILFSVSFIPCIEGFTISVIVFFSSKITYFILYFFAGIFSFSILRELYNGCFKSFVR